MKYFWVTFIDPFLSLSFHLVKIWFGWIQESQNWGKTRTSPSRWFYFHFPFQLLWTVANCVTWSLYFLCLCFLSHEQEGLHIFVSLFRRKMRNLALHYFFISHSEQAKRERSSESPASNAHDSMSRGFHNSETYLNVTLNGPEQCVWVCNSTLTQAI